MQLAKASSSATSQPSDTASPPATVQQEKPPQTRDGRGVLISVGEDLECGVCGCAGDKGSPLVVCECCGLGVHEACFGVDLSSDGRHRVPAVPQRSTPGPEPRFYEPDANNPPDAKQLPGVPGPIPTPGFVCEACRAGVQAPKCVLCPIRSNRALKPLATPETPGGDDGGLNGGLVAWCHVGCALWTPGMFFKDAEGLSFPCGLATVHPERWDLPCTLCKKRKAEAGRGVFPPDTCWYKKGTLRWKYSAKAPLKTSGGRVGEKAFWAGPALLERASSSRGAPIQCCFGTCCAAFHPLCGIRANVEMALHQGDAEEGEGEVAKLAYCPKHSTTAAVDTSAPCVVCRGTDNAALMVVCDACESVCHLACADPPLSAVPPGDWFCSTCAEKRHRAGKMVCLPSHLAQTALADEETAKHALPVGGQGEGKVYMSLNPDSLLSLPTPTALMSSDEEGGTAGSGDDSDSGFPPQRGRTADHAQGAGRRRRGATPTARSHTAYQDMFFTHHRLTVPGGASRGKRARPSERAVDIGSLPSDAKADEVVASLPDRNKVGTAVLTRHIREQFGHWRSLLASGRSILAYGVGSKKALLEEFAGTLVHEASVLVVNGYTPGVTLKGLCNLICKKFLGRTSTFASVLDHCRFVAACMGGDASPAGTSSSTDASTWTSLQRASAAPSLWASGSSAVPSALQTMGLTVNAQGSLQVVLGGSKDGLEVQKRLVLGGVKVYEGGFSAFDPLEDVAGDSASAHARRGRGTGGRRGSTAPPRALPQLDPTNRAVDPDLLMGDRAGNPPLLASEDVEEHQYRFIRQHLSRHWRRLAGLPPAPPITLTASAGHEDTTSTLHIASAGREEHASQPGPTAAVKAGGRKRRRRQVARSSDDAQDPDKGRRTALAAKRARRSCVVGPSPVAAASAAGNDEGGSDSAGGRSDAEEEGEDWTPVQAAGATAGAARVVRGQGLDLDALGRRGRVGGVAVSKLAAVVDTCRVSTAGRTLCLVLHNLDGHGFRSPEAQAGLAILAACPRLQLVASADHVNAGVLMSGQARELGRWVHVDCSAFKRYASEAPHVPSVLPERESTAKTGVAYVLKSLTPNHRAILAILAQEQLDNPEEGGMVWDEWYAACQDSMLVSTDIAFRNVLVEFTDHALVATQRTEGGGGLERLFIPLPPTLLQRIAGGFEDPDDAEDLL